MSFLIHWTIWSRSGSARRHRRSRTPTSSSRRHHRHQHSSKSPSSVSSSSKSKANGSTGEHGSSRHRHKSDDHPPKKHVDAEPEVDDEETTRILESIQRSMKDDGGRRKDQANVPMDWVDGREAHEYLYISLNCLWIYFCLAFALWVCVCGDCVPNRSWSNFLSSR